MHRLLPAFCLAAVAAMAAAPAAAQGVDIAWVWPAAAQPSPHPPELAVLVRTVLLGPGGAAVRPLRRAVVAAPGTQVTPVVHVQAAAGAALSRGEAEVVLAQLRLAADESSSGWVQLDFEAPARLREEWRRLVAQARRALPASVQLSVTAVASWCTAPGWLDRLDADEVVPMLFALGPGAGSWRRAFVTVANLHTRCRSGAAGFSVEAPPPAAVRARYERRYWFHEAPRRAYTVPPAETP